MFGFSLPPVKSVLFAGVGFAGPAIVTGFLSSQFPSIMSQASSMGIAGKYLVKIGSVLGLAWLTRRFVGSNEAHMVMIGGAVNVAMTALNDFSPNLLPANPLSTYVPTSMNAYVPMSGMRGLQGMRGGLAAGRPIRSAAIVSNIAGAAGRNGAYSGVAQRFFRY